jgi:hypothetical protein
MATRRIAIQISGASDRVFARLVNDVWARLSDPPGGVEIQVVVDDVASFDLLNDDYDSRYREADRWEDLGRGGRVRRV